MDPYEAEAIPFEKKAKVVALNCSKQLAGIDMHWMCIHDSNVSHRISVRENGSPPARSHQFSVTFDCHINDKRIHKRRSSDFRCCL